jgi:hypothetical protein
MKNPGLSGWVRQLIFPWAVCVLLIPFLLYWGAWPQATAVALVAVVGTFVVYRKRSVPTVTPERSAEYSVRRAPTRIIVDDERPLVGVFREDGEFRYVWLIPDLPDDEWGYLWSTEIGRRESGRAAVETVSSRQIDVLATRWGLRILPQGAYSDEAWRIYFGRRGRLVFSKGLER